MRRREFLSLAAGLPLFSIGSLRTASLAKRIAAGEKIRVALIGCGVRMRQILEPIMVERVVALVDPDPAMRATLRAQMTRMPGNYRE